MGTTGREERVCPVGSPALRALQAYCLKAGVHDDPLFRSKVGKRVSPQALSQIVEKYRKLSGLPVEVTPHKFRHSFATHVLLGNWKSFRMTNRAQR